MLSDDRQHWSLKYTTVVLLFGLMIGYVGLDFVSRPPSTILVQLTEGHISQTDALLERITSIETITIELKRDVELLRKQITDTH